MLPPAILNKRNVLLFKAKNSTSYDEAESLILEAALLVSNRSSNPEIDWPQTVYLQCLKPNEVNRAFRAAYDYLNRRARTIKDKESDKYQESLAAKRVYNKSYRLYKSK